MTLDGWLLTIALGLVFLNVLLRWPRATLLVLAGVLIAWPLAPRLPRRR